MSEMTTNALINWSLEQAELCRSDYPRPDLADMHEAIAARLKALDEMMRKDFITMLLAADVIAGGDCACDTDDFEDCPSCDAARLVNNTAAEVRSWANGVGGIDACRAIFDTVREGEK